jgi:hypothetical protein
MVRVKSKAKIKEPEGKLSERKGPNHFWHGIKRLDYIFMEVSIPSIMYEYSSSFLKVAHIFGHGKICR